MLNKCESIHLNMHVCELWILHFFLSSTWILDEISIPTKWKRFTTRINHSFVPIKSANIACISSFSIWHLYLTQIFIVVVNSSFICWEIHATRIFSNQLFIWMVVARLPINGIIIWVHNSCTRTIKKTQKIYELLLSMPHPQSACRIGISFLLQLQLSWTNTHRPLLFIFHITCDCVLDLFA